MSSEKNDELRTTKSKKKPNKGPYLLGEPLGEGAFAKVRLATQIHIKEKCAIKIVDKRLLEDTKDIQRLKKEIKILKNIRHKNIIQLFDIMESKTNLYFVMEYCKGGELFDYIVKNKRLKENEACKFFQQIINGVEYLHKQGIIHRDLKPENLLLDYNNNIKISDFGLSTFFTKNHYLQTACGTPSYAPPEMLEGLQYNGETSDIWSCGIILYAMLCGTLPFTESKEEIIVRKIKTHDYSIPKYLSNEAQDMLYHILKINPEERFTIEGIKKHPWFNLIKPHLMKGISLNEIKIPVDENILEIVKNFGFDKEECRALLLKNKFCSLTSIYYLCLKKYIREGGKSISDLESDLFEQYINDPANHINQDEIKNNTKEAKLEKKNTNKNDNNNDKNSNTIVLKEKNNSLKKEKNENNIEEIHIKEKNLKKSINGNNENINVNLNANLNNADKKATNNKEKNIDKIESTNNNNNNKIIKNNNNNNNDNCNKKKANIVRKDQKNLSSKNNPPILIQKKQKEINSNKNTKKIVIQNNCVSTKQNNKYIKNNILIQDKKPKIENEKNQLQQITIKNREGKMNSPQGNRKFHNSNTDQNNFNTMIIKKKLVNKAQNPQKKANINEKKSPKRFIEDNIKSNSMMNSFNTKNKSLENEIHNNISLNKGENAKMNNVNVNTNTNNKFDKIININDNNKEKRVIYNHENGKNIIHSNTVSDSNINNNNNNKFIIIKNTSETNKNISSNNNNANSNTENNKEGRNINRGIFAFGVNPNSVEALNILYEQSKAKEAYQNYRNCIREGNADTRNKSSPFPLEQFGLEKDIDEAKFIEGQKPLNVINYIAKKLVSSSFCGSFNFQYASAKKYSTARRSSAITHNHLISNGNMFVNKESNPINEEIEYMRENSNTSNNGSNNGNNNNENTVKVNDNTNDNYNEVGNMKNDYNENINDINFKNLVSILNQKFKKYLTKNKTSSNNINNQEEGKESANPNQNSNTNPISGLSKNKKPTFIMVNNKNKKVKSQNNSKKNNQVIISNPSINKFSKNIEYKEDLYPNSFSNKKHKNDLMASSNMETYAYNINDMTSHYNKFLDMSTNYDPGLDSRGGSSIERGDSINKNELRNFSFSLDKKNKKKGEHKFKTEYNEKSVGNNYNVIKNTLSGSQNKFNKNINIISENDELDQNNTKKINNKSIKNKYCPFLEKKVSINLSNTFNNLSKSEYKQKKK